MSVHPTDYLVHFSNILLLVSYSVRNILWLRWFAVAAALTNMPYFLYQPSILWPPILWAGVFTGIDHKHLLLARSPLMRSSILVGWSGGPEQPICSSWVARGL
jgi:hypothetical protein